MCFVAVVLSCQVPLVVETSQARHLCAPVWLSLHSYCCVFQQINSRFTGHHKNNISVRAKRHKAAVVLRPTKTSSLENLQQDYFFFFDSFVTRHNTKKEKANSGHAYHHNLQLASRRHSLQVCTDATIIMITVCKRRQQKRRAQQRQKKRAAYPVTIANLDAWHE